MTHVLVIFATNHGNTEKLAHAVAEGAVGVEGASVAVKSVREATAEDLLTADAIIAGSPVQMSNLNWEMKKFIDEVFGPLWMEDRLVGKVGAAFATGGGYGSAGAGVEHVLTSLMTNFAECGMILVPVPKTQEGYAYGAMQWGPYARSAGVLMEQTGITDTAFAVARAHGASVARTAAALKGASIFLPRAAGA
jgi:NAD(P)H dehydrogenase (quinone)